MLKNRDVRANSETGDTIRKESYYAIVNGYKGPYLVRQAMQSSSGDKRDDCQV